MNSKKTKKPLRRAKRWGARIWPMAGRLAAILAAVTVMGLVIANADLPSYAEIYRFKESATILLVSGVFILLAAGIKFQALAMLDWRAAVFVLAVILVVRPLTVMISLIGTDLPWREKLLIALTGPRGVVLVAVSGIFGERLVAEGIPEARC